ncbi:MAG: tRNA uridine-5-carboxymethylaminomethyl(34) synthesis GTPase MnmE [Ruminococcaceae bacterium]|nr:tRNA uridine-5-carboxymethylaminomethyl(34) synthesis GTPase MnmE [Oscillospiraceae bacterium]
MSTVAAISTPYGKGGVAVIRISGEDAFGVADRCFKPNYRQSVMDFPSRHAVYGGVIKDGVVIDHGVLTRFSSPNSFTGEDMVEISCHGGVQITAMVLEAALCSGAVMAQAGEFTKRAFLNGKLTLTQAEAVAELLDAGSEAAALLSHSQLSGKLSKKLDEIHDNLVRVVSTLYASIDYPEEDLEDMDDCQLEKEVTEILRLTDILKASYKTGKAVTGGVDTAIVGKPNAGKSSLFNALAGESRAIVTDIPGTTRDVIDIRVNVGNILLNLHDTAGIRDNTDDAVEKIGVGLSLELMEKSELILAVFDGSKPLSEDDLYIIDSLKNSSKQVIAVINKNDTDTFSVPDIPFDNVCISAKSSDGLNELYEKITLLYDSQRINPSDGGLITNARQYADICKTREKVADALDNLKNGMKDMCGMLLESALAELGELDGRSVSREIVDSIFSRFCVGK